MYIFLIFSHSIFNEKKAQADTFNFKIGSPQEEEEVEKT